MRLPNWPQELALVIEEWRARPFEYGSADCLQFAAEAVRAISGVDYRERFPQYETKMKAARLLCRHGDLEGLISSILGQPKPVAWAMRGDVLLIDYGRVMGSADSGETAGICLGVQCAAPGARGLVFLPTALASKAWGI